MNLFMMKKNTCYATPFRQVTVMLCTILCALQLGASPLYALSALSKKQMETGSNQPNDEPKITVSKKQTRSLWISTVGLLYMQDSLTPKKRASLFKILEHRLGIQKEGSLDVTVARQTAAQLSSHTKLKEKPFSNIYFDDKINLTGYNYVYLETCVLNRATEADRFVRYFENGFYPNRSLFVKEEHYYKILYYYLYLTQDSLVSAINTAVATLSADPNAIPDFPERRIKSLETTVAVCIELDNLTQRGEAVTESPWKHIFTIEECAWIDATIAYFTTMETHIALNSYDWFKRYLPLSISSRVIVHRLQRTWLEQSASHRTVLPLRLFINQGSKQFSVGELFDQTLTMLKMDNREVDLVVLSAMKSWLLKQVEQGIKVEDRITYKKILDELNVCPTGWIFYNLYSCREPLVALKRYAAVWESLPLAKRQELFDSKVQLLYSEAKAKIDIVFSDLEKIFGTEEIYSSQYKASSINHIFHRYRGEIDYTFEYLQAGIYGDNLSEARLPLANASKSCLHDFIAAFVKAPDVRINHINLLNAYTLLFRELASQGKVGILARHENEMEEFIRSDTYKLGSALGHEEDNRYAIYQIIADTYLANPRLKTRALKVAERSFTLARSYYIEAARREGFISGTLPGAFSTDATEVDDFERQYEYFQIIAEKLGKKILLLLPQEDVNLYNRMRDSRNPEGYLL